jgi:transcriptional regulator with XRE-family HTH domain
MEDLTLLISQNLRATRLAKGLSLDKLAELTGVSKSMLGQIERAESSPTVATVWKIANGLKVSFTTLLSSPQTDISVVRQADVGPFIEDNGKYRLYPLFPIEDGRRFEVYTVEIDVGGSLSADAHPTGTQEFMTIFAGEMIVWVNDQEYPVAAGDSIRFRADCAHRYMNTGQVLAKASLVIQYTP